MLKAFFLLLFFLFTQNYSFAANPVKATSCGNPYPNGNCGYYCKCKNGNTGGSFETLPEATTGCNKACSGFGGLKSIVDGNITSGQTINDYIKK